MQQKSSNRFTTKLLAYGAVLAALAIVFGRATVMYLPPDGKYTLDKFVLFLAGMFFGPVPGAIIGFVADVGAVNAIKRLNYLQKFCNFMLISKTAGRISKTGGHTPAAAFHGFA